MEKTKRLETYLPNREKEKITLTLPIDLVQYLDLCAQATGHNRSGFLTIVLDLFYDEIASFAKGYSLRIKELTEYVRQAGDEEAAKQRLIELADRLGVEIYVRENKT